ncbi:hypothetical protein CWS01_01755 [Niallia nealsonii]|uniref:Uncharacterized protein n=1 Tax=Niallia nealsonii TaxID=115979 RepID=A0A2N0Z7Y8_9BACI|nr:hypothetical protein CWS01_01755 [Niallia nealsonii]
MAYKRGLIIYIKSLQNKSAGFFYVDKSTRRLWQISSLYSKDARREIFAVDFINKEQKYAIINII